MLWQYPSPPERQHHLTVSDHGYVWIHAIRAVCRTVYGYGRISTGIIWYKITVTHTISQKPRWPTVQDGCQHSHIWYSMAVILKHWHCTMSLELSFYKGWLSSKTPPLVSLVEPRPCGWGKQCITWFYTNAESNPQAHPTQSCKQNWILLHHLALPCYPS